MSSCFESISYLQSRIILISSVTDTVLKSPTEATMLIMYLEISAMSSVKTFRVLLSEENWKMLLVISSKPFQQKQLNDIIPQPAGSLPKVNLSKSIIVGGQFTDSLYSNQVKELLISMVWHGLSMVTENS
eukprot:403353142